MVANIRMGSNCRAVANRTMVANGRIMANGVRKFIWCRIIYGL